MRSVRALANPPGTDLNKVCPRGVAVVVKVGLVKREYIIMITMIQIEILS